MSDLPHELAWLFPEVDVDQVDTQRHRNTIFARVLERGGLSEVRWLQEQYGDAAILQFFRQIGSPEISPRTVAFWRAYFKVKQEPWADPTSLRPTNPMPWRF